MIKKFTEENYTSEARKPILEVTKPSVHKISFKTPGLLAVHKFYFISGDTEVYLLNLERGEDKPYSQKLTVDEISDLPVEPVYVGPQSPIYSTEEKAAIELLLKIIGKMNVMQDPEFLSFPLGTTAYKKG